MFHMKHKRKVGAYAPTYFCIRYRISRQEVRHCSYHIGTLYGRKELLAVYQVLNRSRKGNDICYPL